MTEMKTCNSIIPNLRGISFHGLSVDNVKSHSYNMYDARKPLGSRGEKNLTMFVPNVLDRVEMKCFCPF
jgi:hypothetical protein